MTDPAQTGSDALRWLDRNMVSSLESPDEAFDWVFMLKPGDWSILEAIWNRRPAPWREACTYIVGEGPVIPSQNLLRLALADENEAVAVQAATSLCGQMLEHPEQVPLNASIVPRLRELRQRNLGLNMNEVDLVLQQLG